MSWASNRRGAPAPASTNSNLGRAGRGGKAPRCRACCGSGVNKHLCSCSASPPHLLKPAASTVRHAPLAVPVTNCPLATCRHCPRRSTLFRPTAQWEECVQCSNPPDLHKELRTLAGGRLQAIQQLEEHRSSCRTLAMREHGRGAPAGGACAWPSPPTCSLMATFRPGCLSAQADAAPRVAVSGPDHTYVSGGGTSTGMVMPWAGVSGRCLTTMPLGPMAVPTGALPISSAMSAASCAAAGVCAHGGGGRARVRRCTQAQVCLLTAPPAPCRSLLKRPAPGRRRRPAACWPALRPRPRLPPGAAAWLGARRDACGRRC